MLLIFITFLLSLLGTGWYRHYAVAHQILDVPNSRSAHCVPVPRGGGIVFVTIFLSIMRYDHTLSWLIIVVMAGIAVLGYWDDKYALSAGIRLGCQIVLSALAVWGLGGMPDIQLGHWVVHFNVWTSCLGVIYLVWMLNLYNFMDGINGIAGFEALTVALGMGILYWVLGCHSQILGLPLVLSAVVAGFLIWNFPKAKVFMGDVGSAFLGLLFGVLSLQAAHSQPALFWAFLIFLGVFIVDATVTLFGRMLRREPLHIAHSSHAYQHAARRFQSHTVVTLAVVALNTLWLWPWAMAVGLGYINGVLGICIAYCPLIILAYVLKKTHAL